VEYLTAEIPNAIAQSLEGVERVAKIVRSMKDFSHPGGETKQAVDLNRALESTLTVCRNEWKYVAEAVTDFDPDLPLVTCLPGECNQVFLNLIINAAHAIGDKLAGRPDDKGAITIATRRDGDRAEIRIIDTGTGIPEKHHARIFDPFFTTKEVGRGTGQGLAIAHCVITEKHGGTIHFETEIGRGTTFVVRLPISGEPSPPKGPEDERTNSVCR
jgi:signal transduction histidine kinase